MVVITSYFGEVAAESPAIAGYVVTVVTREGGVRAQDHGHHIDKPVLILTVELRGRFRFRLAPLNVAATVREKLLSSARVQEQSVASFPRQSLSSLPSQSDFLGWSLFSCRISKEKLTKFSPGICYILYSFFRVSSSSSSLTSFSFRLGSLFHFLPASGSSVSPSTERSVVAVTLLLYMFG